MRTFTTNITEALVNGLSPDERVRRGAPYLHAAKNVKPTQLGLKPYEQITDPFRGMKKVRFPFPQLFRGEGLTLLCDLDKIYLVDERTFNFRDLRTIDIDGGVKFIKPGSSWHFMDFKGTFFLFNGESVVWSDAIGQLLGDGSKIFVSSERKINTGTYHRGRAVFGGFNPNNFWGDEWVEIFNIWESKFDNTFDFNFNDIGSNMVMWGSIGGGDFPLWLYKPMNSYLDENVNAQDVGLNDPTDSLLIDMLKKNEWGFMPMPWQGTVVNIKTLGNNIVVYGDEGVTLLFQVNPADGEYATFGMRHLLNTGIASRSAVAGNESVHVFIDREGSFWAVSGDGEVQRLGYTEFGSLLLGEDIVGSYNPEDGEFYFSTKGRSFLYNGRGLTETGQHITSLEFIQGGKVGLFDENEFEKGVEIVSEVIDFGVSGIKTVTSLQLGIEGGVNVRVSVEYRYSVSADFKRSEFVPINAEGVGFTRVSGTDFRFVVLSEDFKGFNLDYITVEYQVSDKRFLRGINVSQISP